MGPCCPPPALTGPHRPGYCLCVTCGASAGFSTSGSGQTLVLLHHVSPGLCWFLLQLIKSFLRRLGVFNLGPQSSCEKEKCLHLMGSPFDVFPVFYFWLSEELQ